MAEHPLETICRHRNGHELVLETNGVPFFSEQGALDGYRGKGRDISERHRGKKERQVLERKLQQA